MGWYGTYGTTRKEMIASICKDWEKDGRGVNYIAKQYKGASFKGVLYVVGQPWSTAFDGLHVENIEDRFITVYLLEFRRDKTYGDSWAYKGMDESVHPYYYSCPKKYLNMVPTVQNAEWRKSVNLYWDRLRVKRAKNRALKKEREDREKRAYLQVNNKRWDKSVRGWVFI